MKQITKLFSVIAFLLLLQGCNNTAQVEQNGFSHHVFFWMKDPSDQAAREKLEAGLRELVKIDVIKAYYLGVPANTDREVVDSSYDYSLLVFFEDEAGHNIYQDHPEHLKFIEQCKDTWSKVLVYDDVDM